MLPSLTSAVPALDTAHLTSFVRRATGCTRLELSDWHASLIHGGATTNARVYRVVGQGTDQGRSVPWSLVLKEWRQRDEHDRPTARNYWKREACAYQSGLFASGRGQLRPPRCFGVCEQSETTIWLALEDVQSPQPRPWRPSDFAQAAEHLGQFNGSFLQQPLPTEMWLSRDWLRSWIAVCEDAVMALPKALDHPLIRSHVPVTLVQGLRQLWDDRHRLLDVLDHVPQTLCHRDAFVRNLFVERDPSDARATIAIDWATVGIGPIGEDVAALIGGSLVFFELDSSAVHEVAAQSVRRYVEGLCSWGWNGDLSPLRLSYTATLALRYGLGSALDIAIVADDDSHTWAEQVLGHSIAELIANTTRNLAFFLACGHEARALCSER